MRAAPVVRLGIAGLGSAGITLLAAGVRVAIPPEVHTWKVAEWDLES